MLRPGLMTGMISLNMLIFIDGIMEAAMASITIRNLGDRLKERLRVRAAQWAVDGGRGTEHPAQSVGGGAAAADSFAFFLCCPFTASLFTFAFLLLPFAVYLC